MKCKKIFALLLSLCMIASTFVALPVQAAAKENVIDINLPLDDASELTWFATSAVTASNADGVGGRDDVIMVEGLTDSNNNTAGIALPDGFAFQAGDVLTYSIDVYSESVIKPNMWIRNHPGLAPFAQFSEDTIAANTWTTVSKTVTYDEMVAKSIAGGSTGAFNTPADYKFYIRPDTEATVYLDNLKLTVTRKIIEKDNVIDIEANSAADYTMLGASVTLTDNQSIGGKSGVVKAEGVKDANGNQVGVNLPAGFAFEENDILTYSFDVYSDVAINPDIFVRDHSDYNPMITLFSDAIATNTWTTVTRTLSFAEMESKIASFNSSGSYAESGNYAVYLRPRTPGGATATVYIDNFKVTVTRPVVEKAYVVDINATDVAGLTMKGDSVTLTDDQSIGGKSGVVKVDNVKNANGNQIGVSLPEGFAFMEDDVLTYSFDVYSDAAINPDIFIRDHKDFNPMITLYADPITAGTWTTITKTITFAEMESKIASFNSLGSYAESGNYAVYLRPRTPGDAAATIYVDNFNVTVERKLKGEVRLEKTEEAKNYVTLENGVFKATTKDIAETEPSGSWSSQVRLRILPEAPLSINEPLKISFDFKANGIINSVGDLYQTMPVNLRLYDSVDGTNQGSTIGYIKANVPANVGTAVTAEFYIEDMENGGGTSTADVIKSIGVQVDMNGACQQYKNEANDGYYTISNVKIEKVEKPAHEHSYSDWAKVDDENHQKVCACGDIVTAAHVWNAGSITTQPAPGVDGVMTYKCRECGATRTETIENRVEIINIDTKDFTMVGSNVTLTANQSIGGRDGVVKAENVKNANGNQVGITLPDGFAFKADDVLTYSVDIYSDTAINPDIWVRDHKDYNPSATFYSQPMVTGEWVTVTKTATYDELVEASLANNSSSDFDVAGNFAVYLRPRTGSGDPAATVYFDNFKVTVERKLTGIPTVEPTVSYVTEENGVYKITTADVVANDAEGATSSLVRLRIIPEVPVSIEEALKISFDFESVGILNSIGQPYATMTVNLRLYDSVNGETQGNTIGYIKKTESAVANFGAPVTLEYYIEDMENGGGTSSAKEVKSIGIQVDMYGACQQYKNEANDGYFTVSNVAIENVEKPEHTHSYGDWIKVDDETHKKACGCGDIVTEAHAWDEGETTVQPEAGVNGVVTYTCTLCGATKTETIEPRVTVFEVNTKDFTMVGSDVTLTADQSIGGKDGVVKAEGVTNGNTGIVGIKLPDGFAFKEGDIITYKVDVYSETANYKPDVYVRDHSDWNPMSVFYGQPTAANEWVTVTKTLTFADLEAQIGPSNSSGTFADKGNYAVYIRPRDTSVMYFDNFEVTVTRLLTGEPTVKAEKPYVTEENGVFKVTTADVVANEAEGATSSQVRVRIIPETPVTVNDNLKVSFDFDAEGILNSEGNLYEAMTVNLRLYDSIDGQTQGNTIGYIKNANVIANTDDTITVEYYIEDMENGGGTSSLEEIKSIGIQVDMYGAFKQYNTEANNGYFTISNVKVENVAKADHEHEFIGCVKADDGENHKYVCACGYTEKELHVWDEGFVTVEPTVDAEGEELFTCTVCGATKTVTLDKIEGPTYRVGDANGDEAVDVKDVITIRRHITGGYTITIDMDAADVNTDGGVDVKDAIMIRRFITGGYGVEL